MDLYGSDKPDLRIDDKIANVSELSKDVGFNVFKKALSLKDGVIYSLRGKGLAESTSIKDMNDLTEFSKGFGAKGLAWIRIMNDGSFKSPIAKFFDEKVLNGFKNAVGAENGDVMFFVADNKSVARDVLGALRLKLAKDNNLLKADTHIARIEHEMKEECNEDDNTLNKLRDLTNDSK